MSAFLVTVASYRNLHEALLAKGSLESVGIKCVLGNEHTGRMLGTNAVGGLRLQVHQRDADTATGLRHFSGMANIGADGNGDPPAVAMQSVRVRVVG